jgi:hypothetical protein
MYLADPPERGGRASPVPRAPAAGCLALRTTATRWSRCGVSNSRADLEVLAPSAAARLRDPVAGDLDEGMLRAARVRARGAPAGGAGGRRFAWR